MNCKKCEQYERTLQKLAGLIFHCQLDDGYVGKAIDELVKTPAGVREEYEGDIGHQPNDHCYWNDFRKCWVETHEHLVERVKRENREDQDEPTP